MKPYRYMDMHMEEEDRRRAIDAYTITAITTTTITTTGSIDIVCSIAIY